MITTLALEAPCNKRQLNPCVQKTSAHVGQFSRSAPPSHISKGKQKVCQNVSGTIAVVHNGIIENYAKLKAWLQEQGVVFRSQTDTEVIAHLLNYFYEKDGDLFQAVLNTMVK